MTPTRLDPMADAVIHADLVMTLEEIGKILNQRS